MVGEQAAVKAAPLGSRLRHEVKFVHLDELDGLSWAVDNV